MQQSQFNHLVFFYMKSFAYELACQSAEKVLNNFQTAQQSINESQYLLQSTANKIALPVDVLDAFRELSVQAALTRNQSVQPYHLFVEKHQLALNELNDYLNIVCPDSASRARQTINKIATTAKRESLEKHTQDVEHQDERLYQFQEVMCTQLNQAFQVNFTYKEPLDSGLFMKIMCHPATQSAAAVFLLAGLASLAVGICALTGVLPMLAGAAAITFTAAGAFSFCASLSTITAGFFRQRSPFEIDSSKGDLEIPVAPVLSPT